MAALREEMEERIRKRTALLSKAIAERDELEKAVLEVSERERYAAGHDLYDGLCQHLTATALIAHALGSKLAACSAAEVPEVEKIISFVEQGIEQARRLAKDLLLAEITPDGLVTVLHELPGATCAQFHIDCRFHPKGVVNLGEGGIATHLFRIAQEATESAAQHGGARHIVISLLAGPRDLTLRVCDDGVGPRPARLQGEWFGLRIMAHRAAIIGARLTVESKPKSGIQVVCQLPNREIQG